jgi:tetratricopeptide (TPR) repeat protein
MQYDERAGCYSAIRAYGKALADYLRVLTLRPDDPYADYNRTLVYYEQRDYQKALEECQRIIKLKPSNAYGPMIRGLTHARLGNTDLALQDANHSLELSPDDTIVQAYCSEIFCWTARYDEAIDHAGLAISLYPPRYQAYTTLGHTNLMLGRVTLAEGYYKKTIERKRDRYHYEWIIEEMEELIKIGRAEYKMAQQCIALFDEAIAAIDQHQRS